MKLLNEHRAGRVQADVFDGTSTTAAVKQAGVAMKWQPDSAKQLPAAVQGSEGYWVANKRLCTYAGLQHQPCAAGHRTEDLAGSP